MEGLIKPCSESRVADPPHFNKYPDQHVNFNADPDPSFHLNVDLDPAPQKVMRTCDHRSTQSLHKIFFEPSCLHCERPRPSMAPIEPHTASEFLL